MLSLVRQVPWSSKTSFAAVDDLLPSIDQSREIWENAACSASMQSIAPLVMAVSDNSDGQLAANIMDRLESAEAPVMKSSQVVKKKDHTVSELSRQSSDALEKVSEHLTHLPVPTSQCHKPFSPKLQQIIGRCFLSLLENL